MEKNGTETPQKPEAQPDHAAETKIRLTLELDLATNALTMHTVAPTVMVMGMLSMAASMVTQNQVLQRLQAVGTAARIVKPGQAN